MLKKSEIDDVRDDDDVHDDGHGHGDDHDVRGDDDHGDGHDDDHGGGHDVRHDDDHGDHDDHGDVLLLACHQVCQMHNRRKRGEATKQTIVRECMFPVEYLQ
ncbi:hypothetical protein CEXT_106321 [Caerostris extrusa]|uniref:Uncharacterized protein n=1 Tax=Caerostris extrusa TaxID=172846 RepID=A0AAV4SQB4_CAEEX|nr:hypothetical protein CEXT_106321 [Caerostris extrusa]